MRLRGTVSPLTGSAGLSWAGTRAGLSYRQDRVCFQLLRDFECWINHCRVISEEGRDEHICFIISFDSLQNFSEVYISWFLWPRGAFKTLGTRVACNKYYIIQHKWQTAALKYKEEQLLLISCMFAQISSNRINRVTFCWRPIQKSSHWFPE